MVYNEGGHSKTHEEEDMHRGPQERKLELDRYHKQQMFCAGANTDWLRHLIQLKSLADKYECSDTTKLDHFQML